MAWSEKNKKIISLYSNKKNQGDGIFVFDISFVNIYKFKFIAFLYSDDEWFCKLECKWIYDSE